MLSGHFEVDILKRHSGRWQSADRAAALYFADGKQFVAVLKGLYGNVGPHGSVKHLPGVDWLLCCH